MITFKRKMIEQTLLYFFKEGIRQIATEAIVLVTSLFPQVFTWGKLN